MEDILSPVRLLALVLAAPLIFGGIAAAQHSHGYMFVGAATIPGETGYTYWHGNYIHAGGGGQFGVGERFTLGGEIGSLISTAERFGRNAGVLSFGPAFHFTRRSGRKLDPFVAGGVSLLVAGGVGGMLHFGGGANYWFHPRIGLRMEFRDHVAYPGGTSFHFVGGRVGICVR